MTSVRQAQSGVAGGQLAWPGHRVRAWTRRHWIVTIVVLVGMAVGGAWLFLYATTTRRVTGCGILPCTDLAHEVTRGWWAKPVAFMGAASATLAAVTAVVVALDHFVVAGKQLWHDVQPAHDVASADDEHPKRQPQPARPATPEPRRSTPRSPIRRSKDQPEGSAIRRTRRAPPGS